MSEDFVPEGKDCRCNFRWKIKNFAYHLRKTGEYIQSPNFSAMGSRMEWYLRLFPNGIEEDHGIRCYLYGTPKDKQLKVSSQMIFQILFFSADGSLITSTSGKLKRKPAQSCSQDSYAEFITARMEFPPQSKHLPRDTLIIQCQIRMCSDTLNYLKQSFACTRIEVQRRFFDWSIKNFSALTDSDEAVIESYSKLFPFNDDFVLKLNLYWGSNSRIGIDIRNESQNKSKPVLVECKISVVCVDMKLTICDKQDHIFDAEDYEEWSLEPFMPVRKLLEDRDIYLQDDCLILLCEFAYSYGECVSHYAEKHYYTTDACQRFFGNNNDNRTVVIEKNSLTSDLIYSYSNPEQKDFEDVYLRHEGKKFSAHKAILCARSSFFKKMFQNNMKENVSNIVDLHEGDANTTRNILHFIYSDALEDEELNMESALKLYKAANFYDIPLLKEKCSGFLKSNLCIGNVCRMLVIADQHSDIKLKEFIVSFISANRDSVLLSVEWLDIIKKDHIELAEETLRKICLKH